jgi:nucleoside-diphosphate-sugar epimerase
LEGYLVNVLVIGGTRFVGYFLTWRLLAGGHRVTLFNRGRLADPFGDRVERLVGDRTTADFGRLLRGRRFDVVVDCACYKQAEAEQAVAVLDGAVGHYVFISTGQVYLVRVNCPRPAREPDYDGPIMAEPTDSHEWAEWDYGVGKRQCEDVLATAWAARRFPGTRLRLPMVNGERDYYRRLESYLWRVLDGGPVLVPEGGGHQVRHIYGWDVVEAISGLLGNSDTFGQAYNLCQEDTPTLREVVSLIAEAAGAPDRGLAVVEGALQAAGLSALQVSPFSGRWMSCLDPTKACKELGFDPEPMADYVPKIVRAHLAFPCTNPPDNYRSRPAELSLASHLASGT